jgi:hypothetical protein
MELHVGHPADNRILQVPSNGYHDVPVPVIEWIRRPEAADHARLLLKIGLAEVAGLRTDPASTGPTAHLTSLVTSLAFQRVEVLELLAKCAHPTASSTRRRPASRTTHNDCQRVSSHGCVPGVLSGFVHVFAELQWMRRCCALRCPSRARHSPRVEYSGTYRLPSQAVDCRNQSLTLRCSLTMLVRVLDD